MTEDQNKVATKLETAIRTRLEYHSPDRPLIVGVCGSQGSSKSTACAQVARSITASGIRVGVLSLDDLYLSQAARADLASNVHPLFATRGVPGTHDTLLGLRTLEALGKHECVRMPRFDKAVDDCVPEVMWESVQAPLDLILFEGWCIGARPQLPSMLDTPMNALEAELDKDGYWRRHVNNALSNEYQRLFAPIDFLVMLAAPSFDVVARWRMEQEWQLRATRNGVGVMSDAEVTRFVQHFERLTRHMLQEMPARADLVLRLDANRRVTG